jgi:uncharacterized repeat protein (TIGR01451 family)
MDHRNWRRVAVTLAMVAGVLLALGPATAQAQGAGWQWQNPLPQGNGLSGIWGSSGSDVFAVGRAGTILHYDGADWSAMSSGTTEPLYGLWGSSDVFAVGHRGTILHYDGAAWSPMSSGTTEWLYGVWGSAGTDVFAVGDDGTILHYGGLELGLVKAVQPGTTVLPGEPITFTLTFNNPGTITATGVVISDVVPVEVTGVAFHSSRPVTPSGTVSYTWLLGDLPPDGEGVITVTGVVSPGLPPGPGYVFTNTATITSAMVDGDLSNNRDSVRVIIRAPYSLYLPLILRNP